MPPLIWTPVPDRSDRGPAWRDLCRIRNVHGRRGRGARKPLASQRRFQGGEAGDVPARRVEPWDEAGGDGVGHVRKDDRDGPRLPLDGGGRRDPDCHDDVGSQSDQFLRERSYPNDVGAGPTEVQPRVAAIRPPQVRKRLSEPSPTFSTRGRNWLFHREKRESDQRERPQNLA